MRFSIKSALAAAAFASLASGAYAQGWSDDFEGFTNGDLVETAGGLTGSMNGWESWSAGIPQSVVDSSVVLTGGLGLRNPFGVDTVVNINNVGGAGAGNPPSSGDGWTIRYNIYVPNTSLGRFYVIALNMYNAGGPYEWSAQAFVDATAGLANCDCGALPGIPQTLVYDAWSNISVQVDLDADFADVFYNGTSLTAGVGYAWSVGPFASNSYAVLEIQALDLYPDAATAAGEVYFDDLSIDPATGPIGTNFCAPIPNSTGMPSSLSGFGSTSVAANNVVLTTSNVPPGEFGYYIAAATQAMVPFIPPGSGGFVCVGPANIARFNMPAQVGQGPVITITVDLTAFPTAAGPPSMIQPGDTQNFQCWNRDIGASSNFSDGLSITFI